MFEEAFCVLRMRNELFSIVIRIPIFRSTGENSSFALLCCLSPSNDFNKAIDKAETPPQFDCM